MHFGFDLCLRFLGVHWLLRADRMMQQDRHNQARLQRNGLAWLVRFHRARSVLAFRVARAVIVALAAAGIVGNWLLPQAGRGTRFVCR